MTKTITYAWLLPIIFFTSCSNTSLQGELIRIPVAEEFSNKADGSISLKKLFTNIEYIRLETSPETLYKFEPKVYTYNDYLVVKSHKRISLFSRKDGSYLREIGHFGNDPNGYMNSLPFQEINAFDGSLYAQGWRYDLLKYSILEGKLISSVPNPLSEFDKVEGILTSYASIKSDTLVGFLTNDSGNQDVKLLKFDKNGKILAIYENHLSFIDNPKKMSFDPLEAHFFSFNGRLKFKETFNDTLFVVNTTKLEPDYYFELGKYSPDYSMKENINRFTDKSHIFVSDILETNNTLYFSLELNQERHIGVFDKTEGDLAITRGNGIVNDIDNFVSFSPDYLNDKNEVIGVIPAESVNLWFQNNPDKISQLPEKLKQFRSIQPEDNPVVMIAKLR